MQPSNDRVDDESKKFLLEVKKGKARKQLRQGKRAVAEFLGGAGPSAVPVTDGRRSQPLPLISL
jgi:hypothetical protein